MFEFVNVNDYRSFCFRGEGRANYVVSAKCKKTGERIVWRLAKHRKSGNVSIKPKCHITNAYMENLIAPVIPSKFLIKPKMVFLPIQHVHHLAKLPALRFNTKIATFDDLSILSSPSMLPLRDCAIAMQQDIRCIAALEMYDATCIPKRFPTMKGQTITVELKPKQGFFQHHPGMDIPYCNNCVLQIEKWKNAAFDKMYDFCPLDLYSGNMARMKSAISSLIHDPHRNLRIFLNGNTVHSDEAVLSPSKLNELLFPDENADIDILSTALCQILAGADDDVTDFGLAEECILNYLLKAQQLDPIGIITAHQLYQSLSYCEQLRLHDKTRLMKNSLNSFLNQTDAMGLLERYFFAATLKDCSLMISLSQISPSDLIGSHGLAKNIVKVRHSSPIYFAYSIRIVDLDPKSPKNLINAHQRFLEGVQIIKENPTIHRPCIDTQTLAAAIS
uniref:Inositol-pentakisphosphate 2-kinase n=1 Tax=Panagrolaimus davidi TaxID=227884 RepID=A0A914QK84_9BILA